MHQILERPRDLAYRAATSRVGQVATGTTVITAFSAGKAHAAASPTTGVDYVADLVTPVKSELTLAIVAGLGLMVVLVALRSGLRLIKSFGR